MSASLPAASPGAAAGSGAMGGITTAFLQQSAALMDLSNEALVAYRAAVTAVNDLSVLSLVDASIVCGDPRAFAKRTRECALTVQAAFEAFAGSVAADQRKRAGGAITFPWGRSQPLPASQPQQLQPSFRSRDVSTDRSAQGAHNSATAPPSNETQPSAAAAGVATASPSGVSISAAGVAPASPRLPSIGAAHSRSPRHQQPQPPAPPQGSVGALVSPPLQSSVSASASVAPMGYASAGATSAAIAAALSSPAALSRHLPLSACVCASVAIGFDSLARLCKADSGALFMLEGGTDPTAAPSHPPPSSSPATLASGFAASTPTSSSAAGTAQLTPVSSAAAAAAGGPTAQAVCLFGTQRTPSSIAIALDYGVVGAVLRSGVALNIAPEHPTAEHGHMLCFPIYRARDSVEPIGAVVLERRGGGGGGAPSAVGGPRSGGHLNISSGGVGGAHYPLPFAPSDEAAVEGYCTLVAHQLTAYGARHASDLQFDTFDLMRRSGVPSLAASYKPLAAEGPGGGGGGGSGGGGGGGGGSLGRGRSPRTGFGFTASSSSAAASPYASSASLKGSQPKAHHLSDADISARVGEALSVAGLGNDTASASASALHRSPRGGAGAGGKREKASPHDVDMAALFGVGPQAAAAVAASGTSAGHTAKLSALLSLSPRLQLVFRTQHHSHYTKARPRPLHGVTTIASQNVVDVAAYVQTVEECWRRSADDAQALTAGQMGRADEARGLRRQLKDAKERCERLESVAASYKGRYDDLRRELAAVCDAPLENDEGAGGDSYSGAEYY